eukprot:SAG31_NODE_12633_length_928_cov_1.112183_1_plen_131_part_01
MAMASFSARLPDRVFHQDTSLRLPVIPTSERMLGRNSMLPSPPKEYSMVYTKRSKLSTFERPQPPCGCTAHHAFSLYRFDSFLNWRDWILLTRSMLRKHPRKAKCNARDTSATDDAWEQSLADLDRKTVRR